ncbi:Snf7-domain-containing protein [Lactarius hatsudake]|nr:Snf7-domain-containing protein [Lactarius hatsudake]
MSSSPSTLSSLPSYDGLSKSRIQSLYSDISRQKHSNPTAYSSNITWWRSTLEALVSLGYQPNTTDTLILHVDQRLLESLRYGGAGKPLCLGTVIVSLPSKTELVNSRTAVPLQQFLSASQSIYDSGWLPYRVAAFVVGKPLLWALQQLNVLGSDDESETERWKHTKGDYVLIGVLEHAADSVLASQRARDVSLADTLYTFDSFRATFAASALPGVTLSDKDLRVLLKFLERDRRVIVTEREVIKFVGTGFSTPEITAVDHGALELKSAVANLTAQIDSITAKIDSHKAKAANAIRQQHKSLALSYLRSRKQFEEVLTQRLGSLEILQSTLLRVEAAAEDIRIVKAYESSTATLRALLAHPSLQRDAVERTFDALADANADARELDDAVRSGMDLAVGTGVSPGDEDEINAELAALVAEAEADAAAQVREKIQRIAPPETTLVEDTRNAQQAQERRHTAAVAEAGPATQPVLAG